MVVFFMLDLIIKRRIQYKRSILLAILAGFTTLGMIKGVLNIFQTIIIILVAIPIIYVIEENI